MVHLPTGAAAWFTYPQGPLHGSLTHRGRCMVHLPTGAAAWFTYPQGPLHDSLTHRGRCMVHLPTGATAWFTYPQGPLHGSLTHRGRCMVHLPTGAAAWFTYPQGPLHGGRGCALFRSWWYCLRGFSQKEYKPSTVHRSACPAFNQLTYSLSRNLSMTGLEGVTLRAPMTWIPGSRQHMLLIVEVII